PNKTPWDCQHGNDPCDEVGLRMVMGLEWGEVDFEVESDREGEQGIGGKNWFMFDWVKVCGYGNFSPLCIAGLHWKSFVVLQVMGIGKLSPSRSMLSLHRQSLKD
ncbi:hypothetical protein Tco_0197563, partial [Tanacetum coccineum]